MGIIPTSSIESISDRCNTHQFLYVKNTEKGDHNDRPCLEFIGFFIHFAQYLAIGNYFLGIANVYRRGNRILALSQVCLLMRPGQYVAK
ncbi:Uncharacterised protein [Yersinia pseudotuberculosis]|nr:Uncharacterised protein [Yersinia pseudotuberculosis]